MTVRLGARLGPRLLTGPLYMTVIVLAAHSLQCGLDGPCEGGYCLSRTPDVPCYEGWHLAAALTALLSFGAYFPAATVTPHALLLVSRSNRIRYRPSAVVAVQLAKAALALCYVLLAESPALLLLVTMGTNGWLARFSYRSRPCGVDAINSLRTASFAFAAWASACSLASVALVGGSGGSGGASGSDDSDFFGLPVPGSGAEWLWVPSMALAGGAGAVVAVWAWVLATKDGPVLFQRSLGELAVTEKFPGPFVAAS